MLTRIRNGYTAKHDFVEIPSSKNKLAIAQILLEEGYIKSYEVVDGELMKMIKIELKYIGKKQSVITGIKRISKPSLRIYAGCENMPKVLNGMGIAIISTNKGIMTDKKARENNVGGEVVAYVW
jgi:small subunit ribosomal protein S8